MIKKIKLSGTGGQGIKLLGIILGKILASESKNVSLNFEFDTSVRGGSITADLIYSDEEIENPIIDETDILVKLADKEVKTKAKDIIKEETIEGEGKSFPFFKVADEKFGNKIYMNMLALGTLVKHLDLNLDSVDLDSCLPDRFKEENKKAILKGYRLIV